ncbi:TonB-dependent receptor plug domain-containing protein [Pseudomaricurvus alkylphenolicus]|uniref:TonB-dependent receptor plug domain-containing protein n=1 Tax=Pseudomaricurvus alkylphenolicus TaxID=1306991 RepID=UPI00141D7B1A|nr:TonB-dependent receptor plug domain-containing protein [Pseudomaricurvus alkylphenolicus]NIB39583.1 TonB-dependent receptor plug domain-containing protein [Pseudomaricurvus alkylphenolicus]
MLFLCAGTTSFAESRVEPDELFALSLKELTEVEISTGSLYGSTLKDAPSAITVIHREDIELSGARNLATLMEQHVPGLLIMNHSEGNKIGLRGHIAAENYKLLLLVNGKNLTNMVYEGVITEIDQWELGDIERVEVVSGPGSVTYGTGAIAGVINIITKSAKNTVPALSVGVSYNDTYNSKGVNLQYSRASDDWGLYSYLSYRETEGFGSPDYFKLNPGEPSDNRHIGKGPDASAPPQDYLADSRGRPQIKAHVGINKGDSFSAWLRYTQSGQTRFFTEKQWKFDEEGNPVKTDNANRSQTRSLALSMDYRHELSNNSVLNTSLTLDSQEYIRYRYLNQGGANNIKDYAFAQDRITASALYDFQPNEKLNVIAGYEYTHIDVGAPWGKSRDHLWIREGTHIISSWDNSVYTRNPDLLGRPNPDDFLEVGHGLSVETHSHLLESQYVLSDRHKLFYAHRLDFPSIAERMFSPRLSLVTTLNTNSTLVTSIQRAQRMMPLRAQYLNNISENSSKLETIDSLELSYTGTLTESTSVNLRAYYNDIKAVGFTGSELEFLTDYELFGFEFSATYQRDNLKVSLSHVFLEPLDVNMNDDLKTGSSRNNISFSDYYYFTRRGIPILLESYGDGLNNWPKNITKLIVTRSFLNHRLKAQFNAQIYWDFEGSFDEMRMYQTAYDSFDRNTLSAAEQLQFDQQFEDFKQERLLLENQDAFELDYNLSASLVYRWSNASSRDVQIKVFVENLLRSSYRYNVSTGSNQTAPERLEFLDKPRVFGASVQMSF